MSDPITPEFRLMMNGLAEGIDRILNGPKVADKPRTIGFCLLTFHFDSLGVNPGRINYISNAQRADMLIAIKEVLARMEGRIQETDTVQ